MISSVNINTFDPNSRMVPQDPIVQRVLSAIQGKSSLQPGDFAKVQRGHLKQIFDRVGNEEQALERLCQIFPIEKWEALISADFPFALDLAKDLVDEARIYLEKTEYPKVSLKAKVKDLVDTVLQGIETVILAFGISEFFKPAENKSEAKMKAQLIMMVLQFFMLLSTIALPILGAEVSGLVIGCTLLTICLLSLISPYIRPMPKSIAKTENWTRLIELNQMAIPEGRKVQIKEVADALASSKNTKRGFPLLVGKSGVGKTDTAKAFAAAVSRGDFPELKGKRVFYINTADFSSGVDAHKTLAQLSESLGRHRNEIILVWDEIHMACKGSGVLSEQMKTMLGSEFPYIVGITTEEEFQREIYGKTPAFANRFKQIVIPNTEPLETIQILNNTVLKESPSILIYPDVFTYLLDKTKEVFGADATEPATSLRILSQCLKQASETQKTPLETQIDEIRTQIDAMQSKAIMGGITNDEKRQKVRKLSEHLSFLQIQLQKQIGAFQRLCFYRDRYLQLKAKMYRLSLKIAKGPASPSSRASFLGLALYAIPAIERKIRFQAARLGVKAEIDPVLIDRVIAAEKASLKRQKL